MLLGEGEIPTPGEGRSNGAENSQDTLHLPLPTRPWARAAASFPQSAGSPLTSGGATSTSEGDCDPLSGDNGPQSRCSGSAGVGVRDPAQDKVLCAVPL